MSGKPLVYLLVGMPLFVILPLTIIGMTATPASAGGLNSEVPAEYRDLIMKASQTCDGIEPAKLAAQIAAESGWNPKAVSPVGAQGIAQFMPGTWASVGVDGNNDGIKNPFDPKDAIPSMGIYMCNSLAQVKTWLQEGKVKGDPYDLALAAYNAGSGNVLKYGGVPPFKETNDYIHRINSSAASYAGEGGHNLPVSSSALINEAKKYLGTPYVWGGNQPGGFDCSGIIQYSLKQLGHEFPRVTWDQVKYGQPIYEGMGNKTPWEKLKPGDLIFFSYDLSYDNVEHVGIYYGNKQMLHAPKPGMNVEISGLDWFYSSYWRVKRLSNIN